MGVDRCVASTSQDPTAHHSKEVTCVVGVQRPTRSSRGGCWWAAKFIDAPLPCSMPRTREALGEHTGTPLSKELLPASAPGPRTVGQLTTQTRHRTGRTRNRTGRSSPFFPFFQSPSALPELNPGCFICKCLTVPRSTWLGGCVHLGGIGTASSSTSSSSAVNFATRRRWCAPSVTSPVPSLTSASIWG